MGRETKSSPGKVLLLGYAGHGNFGDDLLLRQAVESLESLGRVAITIHTPVTHARSDYLRDWFPGARIIKGPITLGLVAAHDHVVYFGGGIFFDYGVLRWREFLRRLGSQVKLFTIPRLFLGIRYHGVGIGLGPFESERARWLTGHRLRHFTSLGLRDEESMREALAMGVREAHVTPDLSLLEALKAKPASANPGSGRKRVLVCPRHFGHGVRGDAYLQALSGALDALEQSHPDIVITLVGFQRHQDESSIERLSSPRRSSLLWDPAAMRVEDLLALFLQQDLVVSSRMHGIFMAGIHGIPSLAIGVHPKLAYASAFFANSQAVGDDAGQGEMERAIRSALAGSKGADMERLQRLGRVCQEEYQALGRRILGEVD